MSLLTALAETPQATSPASRYTVANGAFYLSLGLLMLVWPGLLQLFFFEDPYAGRESGMFRVMGLLLALIGWFYVMGGRTGARSFVAATVVDRLLLPFVLVPLALSGVLPLLLGTFAILDPLLAVGAWVLLNREAAR